MAFLTLSEGFELTIAFFSSFSGQSGRFETFQHIFKSDDRVQFSVADCVSLYPSQADKLYPTGKYEILSDMKDLKRIHFDSQKEEHFLQNMKMIGLAQAYKPRIGE